MIFDKLREQVESISAIEASELFLSPFIREDIFLETLREPGPSLWIVNRSDVSDRVLEKLLRHPQSTISARAAEKFKSRQATISHLSAPLLEEALAEVPDYGIEDVLGHPLCPWDAMLFFSKHSNEDVRASACLSLTRRMWEHPKQSLDLPLVKGGLLEAFYPLAKTDPSPMVRAYAARIPIWELHHISDFLRSEIHERVLAKWLQNDASSAEHAAELAAKKSADLFLRRVIALDARLAPDIRRALLSASGDAFEQALHEAYLR